MGSLGNPGGVLGARDTSSAPPTTGAPQSDERLSREIHVVYDRRGLRPQQHGLGLIDRGGDVFGQKRGEVSQSGEHKSLVGTRQATGRHIGVEHRNGDTATDEALGKSDVRTFSKVVGTGLERKAENRH